MSVLQVFDDHIGFLPIIGHFHIPAGGDELLRHGWAQPDLELFTGVLQGSYIYAQTFMPIHHEIISL